ncbi:lasso peptide biosynthesis B2 protein [Mesobacillus foraminis]|uniref:lasso peptide biosynthesis B2 protein n=1 Tax=Mesobacillus foraminis TaxID=279826 RepID=UPI000EF4D962|nr:lasso peptide biosynthesis B2 protein [Mesobacillus foraminis]
MNKIKQFLSYDKATKLLFIEAFCLLAWARILKSRSFVKVAPSLGEQMGETTNEDNQNNIRILKHISQAIHVTSKYTFWESQCLVQAIAGMKMLTRRNIEATIYFGTARDETGKLIAHAWLRSGSFYVTGSDGMERFTVVNTFAKRLKSDIQGEYYGKQTQS